MPDKVSYYLKKEIGVVIVATMFGILFNISDAFSAVALGKVIDLVSLKDGKAVYSLHHTYIVLIMYFLLMMFVNITRFGKRFFVRLFGHRVEKRMRKTVYNHLMSLSISDFDKEDMGNLMARTIGDVNITTDGFRKAMMETYDTGVRLMFIIVLLSVYSWKTALITVAFCPLIIIIAILLKSLIHKLSESARNYNSYINTETYDLIDNSLLYRTYGSINNEIKDYYKDLNNLKKREVKANLFENSMEPIYRMLIMLGLIFVFYFGAKNVINSEPYFRGVWSVGIFTAYLTLTLELYRKTCRASILINMVEKASISFNRLKPYLKSDPIMPINNILSKGDLVVSNLDIYAGDKHIISNLSFEAHKGEIIGITGRVGSGKSTLGLALTSLYPYNGSIKLNGVELSTLNNREKAQEISYMGHNPYLMSDTIRHNIAFSDDDVCDVLSDVSFTSDLAQMDNSYDTLIGNNGVRISGGQGQRVGLARALYKKNNLIILDDPFSASDIRTEEEIINNIKSKYKDSIIILMSHRLRIFPIVNRVICLDNGKYYIGTHTELYNSCDLYHQIFDEQRGDRND